MDRMDTSVDKNLEKDDKAVDKTADVANEATTPDADVAKGVDAPKPRRRSRGAHSAGKAGKVSHKDRQMYTPAGDEWGDDKVELHGTEIGLVTKAGQEMQQANPSAWFTRAKAGDSWDGPVIVCDEAELKLNAGENRNILRRKAGIAYLTTKGEKEPVYATYMKIRKAAILLLILALLLLGFIAACLINRVPPNDMVILMADSVGITNNNSDTHANIEGTTSFQSPLSSDTHWVANSTSQHFVMANPTGNTVALAPHIYVDFNTDGQFSDDECIYNKIVKDANGNVTSYGVFIDVGRQLSDIEIDRPISAGQYRAKVEYTAVDKETRTLCNGNEFVFDLSVE